MCSSKKVRRGGPKTGLGVNCVQNLVASQTQKKSWTQFWHRHFRLNFAAASFFLQRKFTPNVHFEGNGKLLASDFPVFIRTIPTFRCCIRLSPTVHATATTTCTCNIEAVISMVLAATYQAKHYYFWPWGASMRDRFLLKSGKK